MHFYFAELCGTLAKLCGKPRKCVTAVHYLLRYAKSCQYLGEFGHAGFIDVLLCGTLRNLSETLRETSQMRDISFLKPFNEIKEAT